MMVVRPPTSNPYSPRSGAGAKIAASVCRLPRMLAALFLCSGPAAGLVAGAQQRVLAPPTTQLTVRCAVEGPGSAGEDAVLGGLPPRPPDGPLCDYPGCDNRGRVMGGLGATYLFQWWPIKVRTHHCGDCAADEGVRSLLTCISAGVPPVPEVCGAGHQVQSKRADPRRDRLQEEPGGRAVSRGAGSGQRHSPCSSAHGPAVQGC